MYCRCLLFCYLICSFVALFFFFFFFQAEDGIRDLIVTGVQTCALPISYEYPPFAERLVLVSSGGIGREVHALLRAASLPGAEIVLPLIASARVLGLGAAVGQVLDRVGLRAGPDLAEMARGYASLGDAEARQAFLHTLRAVIDPGGQRVRAT